MACTSDSTTLSWSIVSWAGESWSWPLWGVFQAPHVGFVFIWTRLAWAVGPMAPSLKDTAKQEFNYNQMQHCPRRSSVMLCVRSPSDSRVASGRACLFVCSQGTIRALPCTRKFILNCIYFNSGCQLLPWHRPNIWLCISECVFSVSELFINVN